MIFAWPDRSLLQKWHKLARRKVLFDLCSAAFVSVMKATNLGHCGDLALVGHRDWTYFRAVHSERQVCPIPIVVLDVSSDNAIQVRLAQYDHMVKTLSP